MKQVHIYLPLRHAAARPRPTRDAESPPTRFGYQGDFYRATGRKEGELHEYAKIDTAIGSSSKGPRVIWLKATGSFPRWAVAKTQDGTGGYEPMTYAAWFRKAQARGARIEVKTWGYQATSGAVRIGSWMPPEGKTTYSRENDLGRGWLDAKPKESTGWYLQYKYLDPDQSSHYQYSQTRYSKKGMTEADAKAELQKTATTLGWKRLQYTKSEPTYDAKGLDAKGRDAYGTFMTIEQWKSQVQAKHPDARILRSPFGYNAWVGHRLVGKISEDGPRSKTGLGKIAEPNGTVDANGRTPPARNRTELLKRAKAVYEAEMRRATSPAQRSQAKEDYEAMVAQIDTLRMPGDARSKDAVPPDHYRAMLDWLDNNWNKPKEAFLAWAKSKGFAENHAKQVWNTAHR